MVGAACSSDERHPAALWWCVHAKVHMVPFHGLGERRSTGHSDVIVQDPTLGNQHLSVERNEPLVVKGSRNLSVRLGGISTVVPTLQSSSCVRILRISGSCPEARIALDGCKHVRVDLRLVE